YSGSLMSKVARSSSAAAGSFAPLANPFLRNCSAPALVGGEVVTVSAIALLHHLPDSLADARVKVSPVARAMSGAPFRSPFSSHVQQPCSAIGEIPCEPELRIGYAGIDIGMQLLDLAGPGRGRPEGKVELSQVARLDHDVELAHP